MGEDNREDEAVVKSLILEASRLGFEIGYHGYIEDTGWVNDKIQEIQTRAANIGVLDKIMDKYNLAKELGIKRKMHESKFDLQDEFDREKRRPLPEFEEIPSVLHRPTAETNHELMSRNLRTKTEDGISAVANLIRISEKSHWVQRQMDLAFSAVSDMHDILRNIRKDGSPETIILDGLQRMTRAGWIEEFSIEELSKINSFARVSLISAIPERYGNGPKPVCKIIALALETIGREAFGAPVKVIEKKCICQGSDRCRFTIIPRD